MFGVNLLFPALPHRGRKADFEYKVEVNGFHSVSFLCFRWCGTDASAFGFSITCFVVPSGNSVFIHYKVSSYSYLLCLKHSFVSSEFL